MKPLQDSPEDQLTKIPENLRGETIEQMPFCGVEVSSVNILGTDGSTLNCSLAKRGLWVRCLS